MSAPAACAVAAVVADLLDVDGAEVDEHADLIECGLDSLAMMRLAARWRSEGYDVSFAQLVSEPTVAAWRRLRGPAAQAPRPAPADDGIDTRPFELALMQHAYWVGRNGVRELGGVAAHFYNEFDGAGVDPGRLDAAVRAVVRRHGMLRVRVADDGTQRIAAEPVRSGPRVHDLRAMDAAAATAELGRIRDELSHRILDVSAGEVFDVQLSLLPDALRPAGTRVHVNLDMIAADAVSLRILLGDLAAAYGGAALTDIGYSYPRYLRDRRRDRDPERDAARRYWTERLPHLPPAPVLPAATDGTVEATTVLRRHRLLSAAELRSFESHARARGLTPAMALATAFAETLTCFSAGPRFLLNLPLFDREPLHPGVADLVGDFTSSVLLAWDGAEPGGFAERATAFQRRFHADVAHSRFSGVEVLRELSRLHGERVLAPVVYTSALGMGDLFAAEVRERFGDAAWIVSQGPQVWLDAQVTEIDGGLLVNWDAREHAFAPGVLDAMFDGYRGLLDRLVAGPEQWDRPVPAMLPADQRAVREQVNATDVRRRPRTLHHAFFRRAAEQPDRPALLLADGRTTVVTYGELAGRALAGAAELERAGVRAGELVGISLPKGPEQAVAALAVLAAGGVYVPIGVGQPAERVARIRTVSGVRHVVTDPLGCGDGLAGPVDDDPGALAYVLHTSGSTGEPKGVEIIHAAATNTLDDLLARFSVGADDRTIMLSELDFDLSVFDLFAPLAVGGAVVCVEEEHRRDAAEWVRLVERHSVTVVNAAPALVDMLLTAAGTRRLGLRTVITGGDVVGIDLPTRVRAVAPGCRFAGLGGTTETAIHSTVCEVADVPGGWTAVPYGTPLDNVRCRVVDALGRDRPDEVPGELWIGGAGVARSYRGRPELTAERFREHRGTRYYATGDVARYRPDGTLEFLGRADHQVKVRGHRIELGEVEAAFTAQPAVGSAVACLFRGRSLGVLVTAAGAAVDTEAVRRCAADRLPAAMRPETVASVDALPLTVNGKIDRGAVAALLDDRATADVAPAEPPRTPVETVVATAWSDLLGVAEVGRDHDFFALGGDSLLATRLVGRLRADGIDGVALSTLFARPVLAEFCATLRRGTVAERTEVVPDPGAAHEPFPLTDVQRAYWLGRSPGFTLGGVGCHFHREYEVADLDVPRLEAAVDRLVRRHPMLRAVVDPDGTQRVLAEVPAFRVRVVSAEDDMAEDEWRRTASHRTFEPGQWPLFAVDAVSRGGRVRRLGVGVDNLVLDALSILVLYGELAALYEDPAAELPPVDLTFRDYVSQVRPGTDAVAQAERYWLDRLDALPSAPALPLAVDPERIGSPRFVRYEALVPAAAWRALGERARHHRVTPSAVLVSAYAEVLARWSGQPDLTLTVTLFDRREDVHPHVHRVLGDFTSLALLPHRSRVGATLLDTVRAVQQELGQVLDHRAVSATWVLRELARRRAEPDLTMPVVFTSALGVPGGTAAPAVGPFARPVRGISQTPQVWLDHQVTEVDGGVQVNWDVVEGLFPAGMVEEMFAAYVRLLSAAADRDWALPVPDPLPVEQAAVRAGVNAVAAPELTDRLLHGPFFTGATHEPARTAVVVPGGADLSHGELAERALRLAALLAGRGVGAGDTVAVRLPKGPDQVTAVLGVLASGAAYVPIGVDQPPARAAAISDRAGAREVVTAELLALATELEPLAHPVQVSGDATAYVIFTSGSTGEPKGVEITHEAARNTVADVCARFGVGADDRVLAVSALDFDLSVFDVFGPLAVGGALVTVAEDERRDARAWVRLVHEHGVTVWNTVPALVDMLLMAGAGSPDALASLRVVLTSGDWVGVDLPGRLRKQAPACRFVAMGGATEAAIWSNWFEVAPGDEPDPSWRSVPYGHPLGGQEFRVVDAHGRDCPDWVTGELWIGGAGVALGYRGDPEGTGARFVTVGGRRWYRTGDLGRYRPGGTLEFLGRVDQQVKVRGHRIELGEIETALLGCAGVGAAVAAVAGTGSTARLVAAIVPELPSQRPGPDVAPGPDPGPSAAVAVARDRDREAESRVVERALCAVLGLGGPGSGPTTVDAIGVAPAHRAVLELWLDWLVARGAVTREGRRIGPPIAPRRPVDLDDSAYQRLLADAGHRLGERTADLRAILSGAAEPSSLLDDPVLAPAALAAADPAAEIAVAEVAARIRALSGRLGRPARVLEVDGRAGGTAARLLAGLRVTDVDYTLMDESSAMIAAARERLAHGPHEVRFAVSTGERVLGPLLHSFDAVLADNVLHRAADPARGTLVAAALLAPGGELLVVEREELTPLAMVTAGLLEGGFAGLDPRRKAACSPLLTGAQWARELVNCGFVDVAQHTLGASFSCFVRAVRPASAATIDLEAVRAALARRLPPHMVPDRLGVVPVPPLSANGKVDRAAVADLLPAETATTEDDEPHEGLESEIAVLWRELLDLPAIGRGQSFFALGGDSLLANRFLTAASGRLGVDIPLRVLFAGPTLAEVAAAAGAARAGVEEGEL